MTTPTYVAGDELPSLEVTWKDTGGNIIDFSTGFTWRLRLERNGVTELEKTTGITGAATAPNVTVDWAAGELAGLILGAYLMQLRATRTSDGKDRTLIGGVSLIAEAPAPPA